MSGDWKPGDVATWPGRGPALCVSLGSSDLMSTTKWAHKWGGYSYYNGSSIRPLIVIDPEDVEQIRDIRKVLNDSGAFTGLAKGNVGKLQAALREFATATPPKPDEPLGLGAVVEDAEGRRYVRTEDASARTGAIVWCCPADEDLDGRWSDIDVMRVLSEGVPATDLGG